MCILEEDQKKQLLEKGYFILKNFWVKVKLKFFMSLFLKKKISKIILNTMMKISGNI